MRNFSFEKNSKTVFIVSAAVILLGLIIALVAGFGADAYTAGDKVYVGKMSIVANIDALDTDALAADVDEVLGFAANASVSYDYNDGKAAVLIRVPNEVSIDEQALVSMFSAKYPDLEVKAFNHAFTGASADAAYNLSTAGLLVLALVVAAVAAVILCGVKNGLLVAACTAHDVLFVFAIYAIARIAHLPLLIGALFAAVAVSAALNAGRVRELRTEKKQTRFDAADAALAEKASGVVSVLVACFIVAAVFVAAALIVGATALAYIAAMIFAVALAALYSSNLLLPALWCKTK